MALSDEKALLKALIAGRLESALGGGIKSYGIANRTFTIATLDDYDNAISRCQERIAIMENGGVVYSNMSGPDSAEPIGSAFGV